MRLRSLRVVVKQGVGVDNIDLVDAKQYGVAVHNTPAMDSEAVAELALGELPVCHFLSFFLSDPF